MLFFTFEKDNLAKIKCAIIYFGRFKTNKLIIEIKEDQRSCPGCVQVELEFEQKCFSNLLSTLF